MRASGYPRQKDKWYREQPWAVDALVAVERPFVGSIMDPCCGSGNIPRQMAAHFDNLAIHAGDIVNRGYPGLLGDYRETVPQVRPVSIVSNPPYSEGRRDLAREFINVALAHTSDRACALLRLAYLEGIDRGQWYSTVPLARVWVSSRRMSMPPGDSDVKPKGGSVAYAWFVFEHGHRGPWHGGFLPDNIRSTKTNRKEHRHG